MEHCTAGRWALWICVAYPNLMPTTRKAALTNSPKQRSWSDMLRSCWDHVGVMLGYPHSPMLAPPTHVHVRLHFTKFVPRIRWAGWTKSKVPTYTARSILFYMWLSHLSYSFVSAEISFHRNKHGNTTCDTASPYSQSFIAMDDPCFASH